MHIWHCIFFTNFNEEKCCKSVRIDSCFFLGEGLVSYNVCAFWLEWFKCSDFSLIGKQRLSGPRKCYNNDLEQLLAENLAQTQQQRCRAVGINAVNQFQTSARDGKDPKGRNNEKTKLIHNYARTKQTKANSKRDFSQVHRSLVYSALTRAETGVSFLLQRGSEIFGLTVGGLRYLQQSFWSVLPR